MATHIIRIFFIVIAGFLGSGCAMNRPVSTAEAGFGGVLVGAGTGALVGSLIAHGDILRSAGLGAAIGLPAGIIIAATLIPAMTSDSKPDRLKDIRNNQSLIMRQEQELESIRAQVRADAPTQQPSRSSPIYTGPTIGNPYR